MQQAHTTATTPGRAKLKIALYLLLALLASHALLTLYAQWKLQGVFFFDWANTEDRTAVLVEVGDRAFAIPKNYLYNRHVQGKRHIKTIQINFQAALPDLEGYDEKTNAKFERLGRGDKVLLSIRDNSASKNRTREYYLIHKKDFPLGSVTPPPPDGLHRFIEPTYGNRELYAALDERGEPQYHALCFTLKMAPSPSCDVHMDYGKDLIVNYSFHRDYLPQWQTLHQKVLALVQSFENSAGAMLSRKNNATTTRR